MGRIAYQHLADLFVPGSPALRVLAVGLVALTAWVSLLPHLTVPSHAPEFSDLVFHAAIHGTVAFTLSLAWPRLGYVLWLIVLALAVGLEVGQLAVPGRNFDYADLAANICGAALGLAVGGPCASKLSRSKVTLALRARI